ncbi:MAG TPA: hypothetical protein VMZ53_01300 [Kofleriaceae bacterium]|nr:hypothetical protein [Kofleriaceae bacterium]
MRSVIGLTLLLAACGNDLAPPGTCQVPTGAETPVVDHVQLAGRAASYDDLRYSPELGKVLAVPLGTARIYMIDPDSLAVTTHGAPGGSESVDASATTIFIIDRSNRRVVAIDAESGAMLGAQDTSGYPDYVRFVEKTSELWVTVPGRKRIQIMSAATLAPLANVDVPGAPEGLTISSTGDTAFTQAGGRIIELDVSTRSVTGVWETGCGSSHGFPQIDEAFGLAIGGCSSNGGIGVTRMGGDKLAGFEAGGDSAILAYDSARHHLFVRGDPGATLDILGVCSDGGTSVLGSVELSMNGHGATVDDRGHVWVADADNGAVYRITDPFPATH